MIDTRYTQARFWKCALQVNPHGYSRSYRGQDHGLNAETYAGRLLEVCRQEEIRVVGLADHGSVQDVDTIRDVLSLHGIIVFPGFEISSTEKIRMVCLFAENTTTEELKHVLGKFHRKPPENPATPSHLACLEIAAIVQEQNGFWYAAHMTGNSGLLRLNRDWGGLVHIWKDHSLVRAGRIPGSIESLPDKCRSIVLNQNPDYRRERSIIVVNAKDVAKPEDLTDSRSSTFVKMTCPCFASFLLAFKDPESRVRLADRIQERFYSHIDSIRIEGGYFDALTANPSRHLNAVIGGRGTGKSTLLECLRYALDIPHKATDAKRQGDRIVSENLGRGGRVIVQLQSVANNMKHYTVIRRYGEPPRVIDEDENESTLHPAADLLPRAEIYGQNEIHELVRSPDALTHVLDRFLPEGAEQRARLDSAYRKLQENSQRLAKAQELKEEFETRIARLPKLEEQARQFKEQGLDEKLKQAPLLEKERMLGPRMLEETERARTGQRRLEESLPDLVFLSDKALGDLPHSPLLQRGRQVLEGLDVTLRRKLEEIGGAVGEAEGTLAGIVAELTQALEVSETRLEKDFAKLPAMAGKDGGEIGRAYQRLLREIEEVRPTQTRLKNAGALVKELEQSRRNLLGEISEVRSARTRAKQEAVQCLNKRLSGKLRIAIVPDGWRQPLRDFLLGLHGVGEQKTAWVDEARDLTVMGLAAAVREGKDALLAKGWGLTPGLAGALTRMTDAQLHALEAIDLDDGISLALNVSHTGERYRSLDRLSTGQQCTAILHLLLLDNPDPLIMDQPEDNLDNAFIADRIVQELRTAKTERQFLFATHNANIPVFGDAEWIGVCTVSEDHAEMPAEAQGSIDLPTIRDQVTNLLEGGKEAFMQRKEKYGFDY